MRIRKTAVFEENKANTVLNLLGIVEFSLNNLRNDQLKESIRSSFTNQNIVNSTIDKKVLEKYFAEHRTDIIDALEVTNIPIKKRITSNLKLSTKIGIQNPYLDETLNYWGQFDLYSPFTDLYTILSFVRSELGSQHLNKFDDLIKPIFYGNIPFYMKTFIYPWGNIPCEFVVKHDPDDLKEFLDFFNGIFLEKEAKNLKAIEHRVSKFEKKVVQMNIYKQQKFIVDQFIKEANKLIEHFNDISVSEYQVQKLITIFADNMKQFFALMCISPKFFDSKKEMKTPLMILSEGIMFKEYLEKPGQAFSDEFVLPIFYYETIKK